MIAVDSPHPTKKSEISRAITAYSNERSLQVAKAAPRIRMKINREGTKNMHEGFFCSSFVFFVPSRFEVMREK